MAASLPDTEMAPENSFQIFVRKTGEAPQEVHVTPTTTVAEIKAQKDLKGYVCCFKGNRKDGDTMTALGVQSGDTINVFRTAQNPAYQAAKRLQRGKAKGGTAQSTAHAHLNLHRQTQEVVVEALMTENQQTREAVAEVRVGVEKLGEQLQTDARPSWSSPTYHVDHATIRTSLERGGFTATQLLLLHSAANLRPPMRRNANGADVPEKVKYQLAQSLCSAAGSGEHIVQSAASGSSNEDALQRFDYPTLASWMEALRHQRPLSEWRPPALATMVEPPAAAKRTPRKRNATDIKSGNSTREGRSQEESESKRRQTKSCSTPPQPAEVPQQTAAEETAQPSTEAPATEEPPTERARTDGAAPQEQEGATSLDTISEEVRAELDNCYYPKLLPADLCTRIVDFLRTIQPKIVKYGQFKTDLVSRPKYVWGIANAEGEYPLYVFGQSKVSYSLMEPMTPILHEAAIFLEDHFGHERGFLNLAMATYYWGGKVEYIPPHQDKSVSKESKGREEDFAPIYNTSFLAVRPFTITTLELIEAWKESKGAVDIAPYVLKAIPMRTGDLVRLTPLLNTSTAHMVPKDPSITELRISLVFRHCDKRWVKLNEYHFDMVHRGRGNQKRWEKGQRMPLPEPKKKDGDIEDEFQTIA